MNSSVGCPLGANSQKWGLQSDQGGPFTSWSSYGSLSCFCVEVERRDKVGFVLKFGASAAPSQPLVFHLIAVVLMPRSLHLDAAQKPRTPSPEA